MCTEKTPWEQVTDFHGEVNAEIALGYRLARIALREMGFSPNPAAKLLIKAEILSGALDAFQVLQQATIGNRRLLIEDSGNHVYSFHYTGTDEILRLSVQPEILARLSQSPAHDHDQAHDHDNKRAEQQHALQTVEHLLTAAEDAFCAITRTPGQLAANRPE